MNSEDVPHATKEGSDASPHGYVKPEELTAQKVEQLNASFSKYLQSYAQVSLELLGRWPTFVPESSRNQEGLEDMETFRTEPELPAHLTQIPRPSRHSSGYDEAEEMVSSSREMALREQVVKLGAKLRKEVGDRTAATNEAHRRSKQLHAIQQENKLLADKFMTQAGNLEYYRETAGKLDEELQLSKKQAQEAESRLQKEKKTRHLWQMRTEKMQKQMQPLLEDTQILASVLKKTEEALLKAEANSSDSKNRIQALTDEQRKLYDRAVQMRRAMDDAKEEAAEAGLKITLLADDREELVEEIGRLKALVGEKDLASKQFDATKQDAIRRQQEEQQARLKSEAEHATALDQLDAQRRRADSAEAENERLTAELEKQKQQVATLVEQDAKREVEQQRLFDTLSELLGRMHYLNSLSPEEVGMGAKEAQEYRQEAIRHLRALREAHSLSCNASNLVLAPASMAMGAAILRLGALPTSRPSPRRSLPNELSDWHMRAAIKGTGANSARSDSSAGLRSDASVSRQRRTSSMRSESILNSWREEGSLRRSSTQGHPPQCQQRATTPRRRSSNNMVQVCSPCAAAQSSAPSKLGSSENRNNMNVPEQMDPGVRQ